jgi:hypothetical protein
MAPEQSRLKRINTKVRQRKRQTWLEIPASGLPVPQELKTPTARRIQRDSLMAKSIQERSAKMAEKRLEFDEKELRHRLRLGTRHKLLELMEWNQITEISEAVQNLILNAHSLGPILSYQAIESPRHKVQITANVARMFDQESRKEVARDPGDEVVEPPSSLD